MFPPAIFCFSECLALRRPLPSRSPQRYALNVPALEASFRAKQRVSHPDFFAGAPAAERAAVAAASTSLNVAYRALRDPVQRAQHLLELQGLDAVGEGRGSVGVSPALLEQVMEAREAVGDAGTPLAELRALRARAAAAAAACEADLSAAFDAGDGARAQEVTVALSYYRKLEEEAGEVVERREGTEEGSRE